MPLRILFTLATGVLVVTLSTQSLPAQQRSAAASSPFGDLRWRNIGPHLTLRVRGTHAEGADGFTLGVRGTHVEGAVGLTLSVRGADAERAEGLTLRVRGADAERAEGLTLRVRRD